MNQETKKPAWATRRYIRIERELRDLFPELQLPKIPQEDLNYIKDYRNNFDTFRDEDIEADKGIRKAFVERTQPSLLMRVTRTGIKTGTDVSKEGQAIVEEFWRDFSPRFGKNIDACPRITYGFLSQNAGENACVNSTIGEGFIHLSPRFLKGIVQNLKNSIAARSKFSCTMAHEVGHILNGDANPDDYVKFTLPYNATKEILADRLGAIICGNPRKYLDNYISSNLPGLDELLQEEPLWAMQQLMRYQDETPQKHLNPSSQLRMLRRWAEILEKHGAAEPNSGNIINRDRALDIYNKSRELTLHLASIDDFATYGFSISKSTD